MGRQLWLADVVSDAFRGVKGFRVDTVVGWQYRGSELFDPIGLMNHHTGAGSYANLLSYMMFGSSIAPLCNIATSRPENGIVRITICNAGRANHAGIGYSVWTGSNGGNYRSIGMEHQNSGNEPWPDQQIEGIRRLNAALLLHMGQPVHRMIDHKTYAPTRKVDRFAVSVAEEQSIVARKMVEYTANPGEPDPREEDEVAIEDKLDKILVELQKIKSAAGRTEQALYGKTPWSGDNLNVEIDMLRRSVRALAEDAGVQPPDGA